MDKRFFIISFSGKKLGTPISEMISFGAFSFPSRVDIIERIDGLYPNVKDITVYFINEVSLEDFKSFRGIE